MKLSEFKKGMIIHTVGGQEHVVIDDYNDLYDVDIETYFGLRIVKVTYGERTVYESAIAEFVDEEDEVYVRKCSECGKEMTQGYCVDGGLEYYCSDECLHKHYTEEEWRERYEDGGDNYWTNWEE